MTLKIQCNFSRSYKVAKTISVLLFLFFVLSCQSTKEQPQPPLQQYENHIGDTPFDADVDNPNFKFCDPADILHKRAFVRYEGGAKAFKEEMLAKYDFKSSYKSYNGYFIIRFAVNCNDELGRVRIEVLDESFTLSKAPEGLENHVLSIFKELKNWKHPVYDKKDYDGYKFITIKMVNGQII